VLYTYGRVYAIRPYVVSVETVNNLTPLNKYVAQLSLTNPRDTMHHDKRQNFKTVT